VTDNPFAKFIPGFDFLQGLSKNASAQMPNLGQWVAPTLNPEEIDKRINELRAVLFWLEQNTKMLGMTIQALEVQRMTLSTLKTMNVPMGDLSEALKVKPMSTSAPSPSPAPAPAPAPSPASAPAAKKAAPRPAAKKTTKAAAAPAIEPAMDPMKWWGALSEQFGHLASGAIKDMGSAAAAPAKKTATASKRKT